MLHTHNANAHVHIHTYTNAYTIPCAYAHAYSPKREGGPEGLLCWFGRKDCWALQAATLGKEWDGSCCLQYCRRVSHSRQTGWPISHQNLGEQCIYATLVPWDSVFWLSTQWPNRLIMYESMIIWIPSASVQALSRGGSRILCKGGHSFHLFIHSVTRPCRADRYNGKSTIQYTHRKEFCACVSTRAKFGFLINYS